MMPAGSLVVLAASVFVAAAAGAAKTTCKPVLTFKETSFSEVQNQQRTWSAALSVDASQCAAVTGPFEVTFVRLKEFGPNLLFDEQFAWRPGLIHVSLAFWLDEAVSDYWLGNIPACACADGHS
jgi:hypothetical protein